MPTSPGRRRDDTETSNNGPSARVLVVDDDVHFRFWLCQALRRLGFAVETAADGVEAMERLRGWPYDLVIADLEMPRMNGFELIREIRATPALAGQYAVMITSHDDIQSKVTALTIGYDDFLTKGCTEVEVVAKIVAARRMLSRQQLVSVALREWQALAVRDELTGVAMRRTFFLEAERSLAEQRQVGIAILDLDAFKPLNDTFGHLFGDRVLRDIGALFLRRTRSQDLIARFGGDEFVLLVCDHPLEDIAGAAERLLAEIAAQQWVVNETSVTVTASCGIAHSSLLPQATLEQLLEAADRDLYAKKWLLKNPGAPPHLYEYPGADRGGAVISLPTDAAEPGAAVAPRRLSEE
jgi:two-component system cell cycle response regulator